MRHRQLSSPTYTGPECNDECAEEDCNPEMCGDEGRAPKAVAKTPCGALEFRYTLPCSLSASTAVGAALMMSVQVPLLRRRLGVSWRSLDVPVACLYAGLLLCLFYCAVCDPGQLRERSKSKGSKKRGKGEPITSVEELEEARGLTEEGADGQQLPRRAHKTWLYDLPIRRYSHYCRWLCNCVGLLNHREYILMCLGITASGAFGAAVDVFVIASYAGARGRSADSAALQWTSVLLVVLHGLYCGVLLVLSFPILKIHIGLVARNELAAEWKRNEHEVIDRENGQTTSVNDLDDDEFNERFDSFMYDKSRNKFDKGCRNNCMSFWCTRRWSRKQLGDF